MPFFTADQVKSDVITPGKTFSCISCGLYKYADTPKMRPFGNFKKRILNIGIAPTSIDDKMGKPFQSKEGNLIKRSLAKHGIDLFEDCLNINTISCYKDSSPDVFQINCCRSKVLEVIKKYKPHTILLFGFEPVLSIIGNQFKHNMDNIQKWRGFTIPDRKYSSWICPLNDPRYILDNGKFPEIETIWHLDIQNALTTLDKPFPEFQDEKNHLIYLHKDSEIEKALRGILKTKPEISFFDYESTGLKPHMEGHRILCVSIAVASDKCYTFPFPKSPRVRRTFSEYLIDPDIGKGAANIKFEDTWTKVIVGSEVYPWLWDTMQASHILDNRTKITGLKFQVYVNYGICDYDSHIQPYIEATDEDQTKYGANAVNRLPDFIEKSGIEPLLTYCGLDSIFEYRLGISQIEKFNISIDQLKQDLM